MLSISSWAITEKNKIASANCWMHLLEITWPHTATLLRLTSNNENVTWDGHSWQAIPMIIGEISENLDEIPVCDIQIGNVHNLVESYLLAYAYYTKTNGIFPVVIRLMLVNSGNLANTTPEVEHEFELITGTNDVYWSYLQAGVPSPFRKRTPDDRILKNQCRYPVFKGIECGYAGAGTSCDRTLATCRTFGNSGRYGGFPSVNDNTYRGA